LRVWAAACKMEMAWNQERKVLVSLHASSFRKIGLCAALLVLLAPALSAGVIYIQPIQVCNDAGSMCANPSQTLFEAEGDKIWAQAGLDLSFYSWSLFNATDYLTIDSEVELGDLFYTPGHGQNPDPLVISLWFVDTLFPLDPGTTFGAAAMPGNAIAIANAVFSTNRLDTIAHEIGHSLGLDHYSGVNEALNLMASGSTRSIPSNIGEIYPDGAGLDQLTPDQIAFASSSPLIRDEPVPEPASFWVSGAGALGLILWRRRR